MKAREPVPPLERWPELRPGANERMERRASLRAQLALRHWDELPVLYVTRAGQISESLAELRRLH
jgi:hypothetical protein